MSTSYFGFEILIYHSIEWMSTETILILSLNGYKPKIISFLAHED